MKNRYTLRTVAALFTAVAAFSFTPAHAAVDCSNQSWDVSDLTDWNDAIVCFNGKSTGDYTINLTTNITLTASSTTIESPASASSTLTINGGGNAIDGQETSGVRPITVAADTTVGIKDTTITGGKGNDFGGGIYNAGKLTVTNSTVSGNKATKEGGGIYNKSGTLVVRNSTITNNEVDEYGGGLLNSNGTTIELVNSTVSGNRAGILGGGIYNIAGADLTLTNSTVSNNTATNNGGIFNGGMLTLTNSIIANNKKGTGTSATLSDCVNKNAGNASGNNNLIQDSANACGIKNSATANDGKGNIIGTDPMLGDLANNGGATQTHALLIGSPAIGAGTTTGTGTVIPTDDQRGFARDTTTPDIGAFEAFDGCTDTTSAATWSVADEISLANAILCFNAKTSETHTINLTADINLRGSTPFINNINAGVELTINGNGKTINGQNIVGVRPITVAPSTTVSIDNTTITGGKTATSGSEDEIFGGGIYNKGMLTLTNSTVRNNSAVYRSGGIENGGTLVLTNSTVSGNTATDGGGGIFSNGTLTLTNSTVSGNTANQNGGGGIYNSNGKLTLTNSTVSGNKANNGGGIENRGTLVLTNSTVSGNTANQSGGGIWSGSQLTLINSTVSGNTATQSEGGGIHNNSGTLTLTNSIIANNTANSEPSDCSHREITLNTSSNNLIQSGAHSCGLINGDNGNNGNIIGEDPKLGALANNGGATQTHALLPGSPAIGAGTTTGTDIPTTDQRGFARDTTNPDIGAFEAFDGCTNTSNSWDVADEISLANAILCFNAKTSADNYTINLTGNIDLLGSTPAINNTTPDVTLMINGDGKTINGQNKSGVRPITVAKDTTVTIDNTTITGGKTVTNGSGAAIDGGGIYNRGRLTLTNSAVSDNTAHDDGGGIYSDGTLMLTNSTVKGNTATKYWGGGIYSKGTLTLTHSTVRGNTAKRGGGIENGDGGTLNVTNSTISGNESTTFDAGGVFNFNGHLTLMNSTVYGNTAKINGAAGAGVDSYGDRAQLTLTNTIIANNTANGEPSDCENRVDSTLNTSSNNLIQSGGHACGLTATNDNKIGTDPKLGPLANNGGATQTHALLPGSPAFNAGTSTGAPSEDQRGFARDVTTPDIGAFEAFDGCTDTASAATWSVADEISLANAILCFNAKISGTHTINLTDDINLLGSTPFINNTNAELTINGNGKTINGQNIVGVRPITVAPSTTVTIKDTTITGGKTVTNGAVEARFGGGIYNRGRLTLTNSTVKGNTAGYGGGINSFNGTLTLTNSTVSGNTANFGGGILNRSQLTLTNSTVSGNKATNDGGGILNADATLTLTNSIIANNKKGTGASAPLNDCEMSGTDAQVVASHSLIESTGASACDLTDGDNGNIIGNDPLLGDLAKNDGTTFTHALQSGSPAINAGTSNASYTIDGSTVNINAPDKDQRGISRPQGAGIDIGAYEYNGSISSNGVFFKDSFEKTTP